MRTRNVIMIVALVCLFVAAGVVLAIALATGSGRDAGFMQPDAQWDPPELPLEVTCVPYNNDTVQRCPVVERTIDTINSRLGFHAFRFVSGTRDTKVTVALGVPRQPEMMDTAGHADIVMRPGTRHIARCSVRVSNVSNSAMLAMIVQHELGHCLWLEHDESQSSIMRRLQRPTPAGQFPPRISGADRDRLRERYR